MTFENNVSYRTLIQDTLAEFDFLEMDERLDRKNKQGHS